MAEQVRVFVSHAKEDREFTQRLVNDLEQVGAKVWWDVTGINAGVFPVRINEALEQCNWFVLVLTPNAINSYWVKFETSAALIRHQQGYMREVIPVLAAPCRRATIPALWAALQRYDATSGYLAARNHLFRAMGLPPPPQTDAQPAPNLPISAQDAPMAVPVQQPPVMISRRGGLVVAIVTILMLIFIILIANSR